MNEIEQLIDKESNLSYRLKGVLELMRKKHSEMQCKAFHP